MWTFCGFILPFDWSKYSGRRHLGRYWTGLTPLWGENFVRISEFFWKIFSPFLTRFFFGTIGHGDNLLDFRVAWSARTWAARLIVGFWGIDGFLNFLKRDFRKCSMERSPKSKKAHKTHSYVFKLSFTIPQGNMLDWVILSPFPELYKIAWIFFWKTYHFFTGSVFGSRAWKSGFCV